MILSLLFLQLGSESDKRKKQVQKRKKANKCIGWIETILFFFFDLIKSS